VANAERILDIGTGTGLIALMLAQRCGAEIVAVEPDEESFIQCCENVEACPWKERITPVRTSLQNYRYAVPFDLIVSNPPYFSDSLRNPDPRKSAARHNDTLSAPDLLEGVSRLLSAEGSFQLILPYVEGTLFITEAQAYGFYCNRILKIRPLPNSEIRRLILSFSRRSQKVSEKFLTIEHGPRHEFTEEYKRLTGDFYLKF
jgi:tRNA1Val (adenine37-N6)-methyltransferase